MNYYWEGPHFSYLHYLSIKSFSALNPDWTIRLYTPTSPSQAQAVWTTPEQKVEYTGSNYFHKIGELDVEIIPINLDDYLGYKTEKIHCVQRSDLFRWKLLADEGGGWSDSDILYIKPLTSLLSSDEAPAIGGVRTRNLDDTTEVVPFYSVHAMWHTDEENMSLIEEGETHIVRAPVKIIKPICPIGFFLASPDNTYFKTILEKATSCKDNVEDYQGMGFRVLEQLHSSEAHIVATNPGLVNVGHIPFYLYAWNETGLLFDEINTKYMHPRVVGIHWYNGDAKACQFKNYLTETTVKELPTCTLHKVIKDLNL